MAVGEADLGEQTQELREWNSDLAASAGPEAAVFRGAMVATRPELASRFNVKSAAVESAHRAARDVQTEQEKLTLA